MAEVDVGGYDFELATDQPIDDYICFICKKIARQAQQAFCCDKIFCKLCLQQLIRSSMNPSCPSCNQLFKGRWHPIWKTIREINQLEVKCRYANKGCGWTGKIQDAIHHEKYKCIQYCSNGCGFRTRTVEMATHISHCPLQIISCEYCSQEGIQSIISQAHLNECPEILVLCPNAGCEKPVVRKNLGYHQQKCPKEKIECMYASVGCTQVCLRDCMPSHEKECVHVHLKLAMDKVKDRDQQLQSMQQQLEGRQLLLEARQLWLEEQIASWSMSATLKMDNYAQLKQKEEKWLSPGFYTSPGGYKMCLAVFPNGSETGKGTHISVYLCLLPGEHDDLLDWPLRGEFTIKLLNQQKNEDHYQVQIHASDTAVSTSNCRVRNGNGKGFGKHNFIAHKKVETRFNKYLKNDILYFQVNTVALYSQSKSWLTQHLMPFNVGI